MAIALYNSSSRCYTLPDTQGCSLGVTCVRLCICSLSMYAFLCVLCGVVSVYIYIFICLYLSLSLCIYIYTRSIYIYIHVCVCNALCVRQACTDACTDPGKQSNQQATPYTHSHTYAAGAHAYEQAQYSLEAVLKCALPLCPHCADSEVLVKR